MRVRLEGARYSYRRYGVLMAVVVALLTFILTVGCTPPSAPPPNDSGGSGGSGGGSGGGTGAATLTVQSIEFYTIAGTATTYVPRFMRNDLLFANGLILRYNEPAGTAELLGIQNDDFRSLANHISTVFSPRATYAFVFDGDKYVVFSVEENGLRRVGELTPEFIFFERRNRMPMADDGQTVLATDFNRTAIITRAGIQYRPFELSPGEGGIFAGINTEMWLSWKTYLTEESQWRTKFKLYVSTDNGFQEKTEADFRGLFTNFRANMIGRKFARNFDFLFSKDLGIRQEQTPREFYDSSKFFLPIQKGLKEYWITHLSKDPEGFHLFDQQLKFSIADPVSLERMTVQVLDRLGVPVTINSVTNDQGLVPTGYTDLAQFSLGTDTYIALMDWDRERLVTKFLFNSFEGLDKGATGGPGAIFGVDGKYYAARRLLMEARKNGESQVFKYVGPFGYGVYERSSGRIWFAQTHCDGTKVVGFYNPSTEETKVATRVDTEFERFTSIGKPRSPDIVHALGITDRYLVLVHGEKVDYAGFNSFLLPVVELYSKSDLSFVRKFSFRNDEAGIPSSDRLNSFSTSRNGLVAISSRSTRYAGYPRTVVYNENGELVAEIEGIDIQNSYYYAWNSDLSEDGKYVVVVAGLSDSKDAILLFELDRSQERKTVVIPNEFARIGVRGAKLVKALVKSYATSGFRCDSRMPYSKTTLLEGNRFVIFTSTPFWSERRTAFVADLETGRVIDLQELRADFTISRDLLYANHDRYGNIVLVRQSSDSTVQALVAKLVVR